MENKGHYPFYEIVSSSLTAGVYASKGKEDNPLVIEKSIINENNFATISIAGPKDQRVVTITYRNVKGKELWSTQINEKEISIAHE